MTINISPNIPEWLQDPHNDNCERQMDFGEQLTALKDQLPKNEFLNKPENQATYSAFLSDIYCNNAEDSLKKLDERTKIFFENDENREAIPASTTIHPDFLAIVSSMESANGKLLDSIVKAKLKKYGLDAEHVSEANFTEENKAKVAEEFDKAAENARTVIEEGMARLARLDLPPGSELAPTFDLEELRLVLPEMNMLYAAWDTDNVAFSEQFFLHLGKLTDKEKEGLTEEAIRSKEREKKRKDLLTLYRQLNDEVVNPDSKVTLNSSIKLGWVIHEIQALDYNEQMLWFENYISEVGSGAEAKIEEVITNKAVALAATRELFRDKPEYQRTYPNLYAKMENGELRKELEKMPKDILGESPAGRQALDKERAEAQKGTGDAGKISAPEVLSRSPLRAVVGAYGIFAGVMGIVLNILARKDLLMHGDILGVLKNPSLGISLAYLGLGTEMITGVDGMGSGWVSGLLDSFGGEVEGERISNQKIIDFSRYCRTYLDIRQYLSVNFEDVKSAIEAKQEERKGIQEQISEGVLNSEEQGKDFTDFVKKDPEFLKNITGLDGFTREETIAKIVDMYVFTRFAKDKPENKEDFDRLVAKILNPSEHPTV